MSLTSITTTTSNASAGIEADASLIYRFEAQLAEMYPVGLFPEGLRFHNDFEGTIVEGPFAGGRIFGLDQFMVRPDGIGVIVAPEVIELGDVRVSLHVLGYVIPPQGMTPPPLELIASPGFEFPDAPFTVTGSAMIKTANPEYAHLNHTVAVIDGTVNLSTGRLDVAARSARHLSQEHVSSA